MGGMSAVAAEEAPSARPLKRLRLMLGLIKIEHTIFAAPFCLASLLVATGGRPEPRLLLWVVVALTAARASAMAFNRLVDAEHDAANERTKMRHLPTGAVSKAVVSAFTACCVSAFVLASAQLNSMALALSPVALVVILGYSYTKRFTKLSHLVLGLALGIAPMGAWVAARGELSWHPVPLSGAVLLWVAGFDIIYACQDIEFDRKSGLHSIPASLGVAASLWLARVFHVLAIGLLVLFGLVAGLGHAYFAGVCVTALLMAWEHRLVRADDLSKLGTAFFTANGAVSLVILAATAADIYLLQGATKPV